MTFENTKHPPAPGSIEQITISKWAVAEAIAVVDAQQREADEKRGFHSGAHPHSGARSMSAAVRSVLDEDEAAERISRR